MYNLTYIKYEYNVLTNLGHLDINIRTRLFWYEKNIEIINYFYDVTSINYNNCENYIKSKVLINSKKLNKLFKIIIYLYKKYLFFLFYSHPKQSLQNPVHAQRPHFLCLNIETKNLYYDNV